MTNDGFYYFYFRLVCALYWQSHFLLSLWQLFTAHWYLSMYLLTQFEEKCSMKYKLTVRDHINSWAIIVIRCQNKKKTAKTLLTKTLPALMTLPGTTYNNGTGTRTLFHKYQSILLYVLRVVQMNEWMNQSIESNRASGTPVTAHLWYM